MNLNIIADTGFWIALLDPAKADGNYAEAERISDDIDQENLVIPFPTLYEFVNSRLSRRAEKFQFQKILERKNTILLNDGRYKKQALKNFLKNIANSYSDLSLVDEVLKLIIVDPRLKIDYLASFDQGLINHALSVGIKKV